MIEKIPVEVYNPRYLNNLEQVLEIVPSQYRAEVAPKLRDRAIVTEKFDVKANDYYLNLIDWENLDNDPIARIILPHKDELESGGRKDPSSEKAYLKTPDLEDKYGDTVIVLVNDGCGGYCRYCFRKDDVYNKRGNRFVVGIDDESVEYIREHKPKNVLLSGGDPLLLGTKTLENIIKKIRDYVPVIRIGTKMTAFNPYRILNDPGLPAMLNNYINAENNKAILIVNHFDHPRELTKEARKGLDMLNKAGVTHLSQTPITAGVNDNYKVIEDLINDLVSANVIPYYFFIMRPAEGNSKYAVPIERVLDIVTKAKENAPGPAKKAVIAMSHYLGKVEIHSRWGKDYIIIKFHRAANPENREKTVILKNNPNATWLDDYEYWLNPETGLEEPFDPEKLFSPN